MARVVQSNKTVSRQDISKESQESLPAFTSENSHLLLGNPSDAKNSYIDKNNHLIQLTDYVLSYNEDRGIANWVSWHLSASEIEKNVDRNDNFKPFSALPEGWHIVTSKSYTHSGFDRGHHCPSADRLHSFEANSATFYMINILPQAPKNNQRVWNNFEDYLRKRVQEGNEIYIIMGSYGDGGIGSNGYAERIDEGKIAVPARIWKIAVILPEGDNDLKRIESGDANIIAIDTPNSNKAGSKWEKYQVDVRSIERATGLDFLSNISTTMQDELEIEYKNAA